MGEAHRGVHVVGCPRLDTVLANDSGPRGGGDEVAPFGDAVVLLYHPVTTLLDQHSQAVLEGAQAAAQALEKPLHVIWPNSDAGREEIAAVIRGANVMTHRRTTPEQWARVLNTCAVLIGNSSSGLRDGAILGTPVVNVGDRQRGRECGPNVVHVPPVADAVAAAAIAQAKHGRYEVSTLYGDGNAAKRIVDVLSGELPAAQKVWAA
jgi:UDP-N-acetylglucosamine 2-epimerase